MEGEEGLKGEDGEGVAEGRLEEMRRRIERRLPLLLRCCGTSPALLAMALAAAADHPMLLLLLYMKVSTNIHFSVQPRESF